MFMSDAFYFIEAAPPRPAKRTAKAKSQRRLIDLYSIEISFLFP
jgi:hypothetical protein